LLKIFYRIIIRNFKGALSPSPQPSPVEGEGERGAPSPLVREGWGEGVIAWFLLLLLSLTCLSCSDAKMKKLTIQKINSSSTSVSVHVEVADNDEARLRGLMFRKSMGEKQGMLFVFDQDSVSPFWMKNTYLPLDILFIGDNNEIVDIVEKAQPLSEELIRPSAPYRLALEVNAGFVKQYKIEMGDRVVF
jgi:uncharacterized membrane protein (UPF0127 family)